MAFRIIKRKRFSGCITKKMEPTRYGTKKGLLRNSLNRAQYITPRWPEPLDVGTGTNLSNPGCDRVSVEFIGFIFSLFCVLPLVSESAIIFCGKNIAYISPVSRLWYRKVGHLVVNEPYLLTLSALYLKNDCK